MCRSHRAQISSMVVVDIVICQVYDNNNASHQYSQLYSLQNEVSNNSATADLCSVCCILQIYVSSSSQPTPDVSSTEQNVHYHCVRQSVLLAIRISFATIFDAPWSCGVVRLSSDARLLITKHVRCEIIRCFYFWNLLTCHSLIAAQVTGSLMATTTRLRVLMCRII